MFSKANAIAVMKSLIQKIEKGDCLVMETKTKRTSVKLDDGAACLETHLGDTTTLSITVIDWEKDK